MARKQADKKNSEASKNINDAKTKEIKTDISSRKQSQQREIPQERNKLEQTKTVDTKIINESVETGKQLTKRSANRKKTGLVDAKTGKRRSGYFKTPIRAIMLTLMVAYAVTGLIIGIWVFREFFQFYITEKSPVLGLDTTNSRVVDKPIFTLAEIKNAEKAVLESDIGVDDLVIHQVGPSLHVFITLPDNDDMGAARDKGSRVIDKLREAFANPDLFRVYEAQIIVTKKDLPKLEEAVLLRPATEEHEEQQFPQFGVLNKNRDTIQWGRNGE
ncbi:hypothetical protein AwErysi_02560 [Erysipelotrichaceae bacterium]|nr:hypothetical protein AwErysi_02560 [Erysipelotrichaceae bacterium]